MRVDSERDTDRDPAEFLRWLEVPDPDAGRRHAQAALGALAVHALVFLLVVNAPAGAVVYRSAPEIVLDFKRSVPLVAPRNVPPFKLTQKEAQRSEPATEVDIAALQPKPEIRRPQQTPPGKPFTPPPATLQAPLIEAPKVEVAQAAVPAIDAPKLPAAPPPETNRNPFERVAPAPAPQAGRPPGQVPLPKTGVTTPSRGAVRSGGRGMVVGDGGALGAGGVSEAITQSQAPGRPGSALELLSDPQGIDFRPYLVQVLASVKRNWLAVFPESARFGRQGRVAIQFAIDRNGRVPKLVIAMPSGTEALDRAGVAGISASNPFPPLPTEFRGNEIRLQLVFSYNMPR